MPAVILIIKCQLKFKNKRGVKVIAIVQEVLVTVETIVIVDLVANVVPSSYPMEPANVMKDAGVVQIVNALAHVAPKIR